MTFSCRLETATSMFFLLKEGRSSRPQHGYGTMQAEFPMGPVTRAHGGTYRCFGSYNKHAWSFPSEPVKLLVKGEDTPPPPDTFRSFFCLDPAVNPGQEGGRQRRGGWEEAPHPLPQPLSRGAADSS